MLKLVKNQYESTNQLLETAILSYHQSLTDLITENMSEIFSIDSDLYNARQFVEIEDFNESMNMAFGIYKLNLDNLKIRLDDIRTELITNLKTKINSFGDIDYNEIELPSIEIKDYSKPNIDDVISFITKSYSKKDPNIASTKIFEKELKIGKTTPSWYYQYDVDIDKMIDYSLIDTHTSFSSKTAKKYFDTHIDKAIPRKINGIIDDTYKYITDLRKFMDTIVILYKAPEDATKDELRELTDLLYISRKYIWLNATIETCKTLSIITTYMHVRNKWIAYFENN